MDRIAPGRGEMMDKLEFYSPAIIDFWPNMGTSESLFIPGKNAEKPSLQS